MYTLHIANKLYSSWSLRPWLLMKELGIAFEETLHPFDDGSSWASFRAFSPTGKVPCLEIDGEAVWDSLAIIEYLAERHAGVWSPDPVARAWSRSAAAEMHSGFGALRDQCSMRCGIRIEMHEVSAALRADLERIDELWRTGLARFGGPFLAGELFTAVDAFYAPVVLRAQGYGLPLGEVATAYAQRILALDSMREWVAAAIQEPWREPGHEAEIRAAGTVLSDAAED